MLLRWCLRAAGADRLTNFLLGPDALLRMPEIGAEIALAERYAGIDYDGTDKEAEPG